MPTPSVRPKAALTAAGELDTALDTACTDVYVVYVQVHGGAWAWDKVLQYKRQAKIGYFGCGYPFPLLLPVAQVSPSYTTFRLPSAYLEETRHVVRPLLAGCSRRCRDALSMEDGGWSRGGRKQQKASHKVHNQLWQRAKAPD
jgi:hypothetical protein